jgi:hypothetical protein
MCNSTATCPDRLRYRLGFSMLLPQAGACWFALSASRQEGLAGQLFSWLLFLSYVCTFPSNVCKQLAYGRQLQDGSLSALRSGMTPQTAGGLGVLTATRAASLATQEGPGGSRWNSSNCIDCTCKVLGLVCLISCTSPPGCNLPTASA